MILGVLASGTLGHIVLIDLDKKYAIEFVMTDRFSEAIISFCENQRISCFIGNPREGRSASFIENKKVDVLVSVNYIFIIDRELIELPALAAFNIHGSLLPKYRGRTPHVWAIINNEAETGVTAHLIDEGCDTGDILKQITVPIGISDTGAVILNKFESIYPEFISTILEDIQNRVFAPIKQDHAKATIYDKRTPEDGLINWEWHKERIFNWVRAQAYPYPGAFTFLRGEKMIIDRVSYSDFGFNSIIKNGQIIGMKNENPIVKVANGALELTSIRTKELKFTQNEKLSNEFR